MGIEPSDRHAIREDIVRRIAKAAGVPKEGREALRDELQHAVDYAWSIAQLTNVRLESGDLKRSPKRIELAAQTLLDVLREQSPGARSRLNQALHIISLTLSDSPSAGPAQERQLRRNGEEELDDIRVARISLYSKGKALDPHRLGMEIAEAVGQEVLDAARRATRKPTSARERTRHQRMMLIRVAEAITAAGGRRPTLNKNSHTGGTWPAILAELGQVLPPEFLDLKPSALAQRTRFVARALKERRETDRRLNAAAQVDKKSIKTTEK
jgi:hypothetical protein